MKKKEEKAFENISAALRFVQLALLFALMEGLILIYFQTVLGILVSLFFIGLLAYSFVLQNRIKNKVKLEIKEQVDALSDARAELFTDTVMPVALLDKLGTIWWYNEAFLEMTQETSLMDRHIRGIFTDLQMEHFPKEDEVYEKVVSREDSVYKLICHRTQVAEKENSFNYALYLLDITQEKILEEQVKKQRCMVGYLYIDNFEEVTQSIEEVRRPMLTAIIDRKINVWFKNHDVVLSKFDRDRYMFFFTQENLKKMQERKFDILDEIRHIQVGNELPVTISIGIGQNYESLTKSKDEAKAAFDLALGRGGDQAIIKKQDKYTFYGGKTKEVEKSARVKVRIKAYAFKELLEEADKVYIVGHKNIDMDCLGAAMGVYRAASMMGKKAQIVLNGPTFAIQGLYDRIMESAEYEKLFITHEQAKEGINKDTLVVVVDVHRRSYLECPELLEHAEKIVVFDHHRRSTDFIDEAVLTYVEPFISSTCEMISEILIYLTDKVKLTQIEADALLAGITIDTKNFAFKAGVRTFEAAAFLRRVGADSTRVRMLFQSDLDMYKIRASAIKDTELWKDEIGIAMIDGNLPHSNILAAQVADELLNIKGIQTAFVITVKNEELLISARALGDMNVQRIMEILGGGGHKNIAGAQLKDITIDEAKEKLKEAIEKYLEEGE